jgi:hypothetical protein
VLPLPYHKSGKRLLFKNENSGTVTLRPKGKIDGKAIDYTLKQYDFVELEDDGENYWIIKR